MGVSTFGGAPIQGASEEAIEGFLPGARTPYAVVTDSPSSWNAKSPTASLKVGWILKQGGKEIANYAFSINPQSISRTDTTRTQMFATRGGFYVDDFGGGPTTIQIDQLVGSGAPTGSGNRFETLREHVLRFEDEIWTTAVGQGYSNSPIEVFFYDNHLYHSTRESAFVPERVYFPAQGKQLLRAVSANNVWKLQLTMITLDKPTNPIELPGHKPKTKIIIVKANETLKKIAVSIAGKHANHKQILTVENFILHYNPTVRKTRYLPIFSPLNAVTKIGEVKVQGYHVAAGQKLTVPA
jgi:hypothetical protein